MLFHIKFIYYCFMVSYFINFPSAAEEFLVNGDVTLSVQVQDEGIKIYLARGTSITLQGTLGIGQKNLMLTRSTNPNAQLTYKNENVQLSIYFDTENAFQFQWLSNNRKTIFQDCIQLSSSTSKWYGAYLQESYQIQHLKIIDLPFISSNNTPIIDPYFLSTKGVFIYVKDDTPLFIDQNNFKDDHLCLIAKLTEPYTTRSSVFLNHTLASFNNITEAHLSAINNLVGKHKDEPNSDYFKFNIWSTYPKVKDDDLSDDILQHFASNIRANGYRGEIRIENNWESCYGSLQYNNNKLPQINSTLAYIARHSFWTSLSIHPYVGKDCEDLVKIGQANGYFVKDNKGNDLITWYKEKPVYVIDFTNKVANLWFSQRLSLLKHVFMKGFGFIGGEINWYVEETTSGGPSNSGNFEKWPNKQTTNFNLNINKTDYAHVTSGWKTQHLAVLTRIPEKQPNWSKENGLASVIVNLLQANILGYTMILPPVIGGIGEQPSAELFIRWVQANIFMPVMHWGHLPWEIDSDDYDVMGIVKNFTNIRYWYTTKIKNVCIKSRTMGHPVNGPIWWIDPTNSNLFGVDDEYMLSNDLLVAPVLVKGATSRDIVLPNGIWKDGNNGTEYIGGQILKDYPAPINVLPFFIKRKS